MVSLLSAKFENKWKFFIGIAVILHEISIVQCFGSGGCTSPGLPYVTEYCATISKGSIVEIFCHKECRIGLVQGILFETVSEDKNGLNEKIKSKIEVSIAPKVPTPDDIWETMRVDVGQITTVWNKSEIDNELLSIKEALITSHKLLRNLPIRKDDKALEALWVDTKARKPKLKLTKKEISNLDGIDENIKDVLKRILKQERALVTGRDAASYLIDNNLSVSEIDAAAVFAGSQALANDASLGGRFKRSPCHYISYNFESESLVVLNGGWLALDDGSKLITEAKRFVERSSEPDDNMRILTEADQRIANRLECLAMGQALAVNPSETLEIDVKAALNSMNLPLTPDGAADALILIGRWTKQSATDSANLQKSKVLEPWSKEVLDAAKQLVEHNKKLHDSFVKSSVSLRKSNKENTFEGRVNLTRLPCICIDAKGTQFRDDAIGIRLRSSTGRKLMNTKWELLIHITDVSDLYSPTSLENFEFSKVLVDAAKMRGFSRYDLPLGPLHLLPPIALNELALKGSKLRSVNRCATIWVYVDEKTGKLIDYGMERTIVAPPVQLTFESASKLLKMEADKIPPNYKTEKIVLDVFERLILVCDKFYIEKSDIMKTREKRLAVKELINMESSSSFGNGFQRSRGHRLVDAALNIYGMSLRNLMKKISAPLPFSVGAGSSAKGGRVGTAPLRRYIDGVSQRQALAALCGKVLFSWHFSS